MILHQVESLAAAGVTDIVLAVNYRPDIMVAALKKVRSSLMIFEFNNSGDDPLTDLDHSMKRNTMLRSHSLSRPNPSAQQALSSLQKKF